VGDERIEALYQNRDVIIGAGLDSVRERIDAVEAVEE